MSTNMYLKQNSSTKIKIPVLPESIKVSFNANNSSISVVDIGEITLLQGRKANQYSFSSFFPATAFRGSVSKKSLKKPKTYVNQIKKWINNKTVVEFILTRDKSKFFSIDQKVTIEKFEIEESGDDVGTINYSITLKEYRSVSINKIKTSSKKAVKSTSSSRTSTKTKSKTYTVKSGDCLWNIAKKYYGDGSKYTKIYNANKSVIESTAKKYGKKSSQSGHWIYPGTVLTIPSS